MLKNFLCQLTRVLEGEDPLILELFTSGGEADTARRIALELRLVREVAGRRAFFLGKTAVYSAGVTIMAAFPREDRYLTRDAVLLVHERRLERQVQFSGPLSASFHLAREVLAQIEIGLKLEREDFAALVAGSTITQEELLRRARDSWYIPAEEALARGLVAGLI